MYACGMSVNVYVCDTRVICKCIMMPHACGKYWFWFWYLFVSQYPRDPKGGNSSRRGRAGCAKRDRVCERAICTFSKLVTKTTNR